MFSAGASAQSSQSPRPVAQAGALQSAPELDGEVINDPAWSIVTPIESFWQIQPRAGQAASQRTQVYIGYTDAALHIGFVGWDEEPLAIVSTDSRRDSSLDDTDSFRVLIDGLLDRQNGYVFGTNPAGIEFDGQVSREGAGQSFAGGEGGFNSNWDTTWSVATATGDFGWSAEMEIPFSSLRFGRQDIQTWGFNFERRIRRNNEVAFWAPLSQDRSLYRVSEAGSVEGIRVPRQRNLQLTPYALGRSRRDGSPSVSQSDEEFGFDLKYSITPSLTLDATYNTDFAQVEVDEQQVNLDRFSLFFPEKRAFFLENSGQFTVGNAQEAELFFSRRIGIAAGTPTPIDGGLRMSGKIGSRTNIGLLQMSSEAVDGLVSANDYSVARINQELPNRSAIGGIYVKRDGDGSLLGNPRDDHNETIAIDGRWGIGRNALIQAWMAQTDTPGLIGDDDAFSLSGDYNDADWTFGAGYTEIGEQFNPEVGFLARRGYRKFDGRIFRRVRPPQWPALFEIRPHVVYRGYWGFDDFQETGFLHMDAHWEFQSGQEVHTGYNLTTEGLRAGDPNNPNDLGEAFQIVPDIWIPAGTYRHGELQLVWEGDRSAPLNFSVRSFFGGRFGGDRVTLQPTVRYRVGERFNSEFAYTYNDFDVPAYVNGDFSQPVDTSFTADLWRARLSYSFSPRMLLQMLVQWNEISDQVSTNLRFSWLQSANTGLYLVYNEVDENDGLGLPRGREFVIKYSRIFDLLR